MIELIAGIIVIVPILLFAIDVGTVFMGSTINSSLCREAARCAAQAAPNAISPGSPQARAALVVGRQAAQSQGAIRVNPACITTETVTPPIPTQPFGGPVIGNVTVKTSVDVYPPFLLGAFGYKKVTLNSSQTFPYTYVMSSAFSVANGGGGGPGGGGVGPGGVPNLGGGGVGPGNGAIPPPGTGGGGVAPISSGSGVPGIGGGGPAPGGLGP